MGSVGRRAFKENETQGSSSHLQIETISLQSRVEGSQAIIFFSDLIQRKYYNACVLISTVDVMTNPQVEVAPELLPTQSCNDFGSFTEKILKIRQEMISSISGLTSVILLHLYKINQVNMSQFNAVDHKTLEEVVLHLKSTTRCLDSLPKKLHFFGNAANSSKIQM